MAGGCDGIDDSVVARERAVVLEELAQRDAAGLRERPVAWTEQVRTGRRERRGMIACKR